MAKLNTSETILGENSLPQLIVELGQSADYFGDVADQIESGEFNNYQAEVTNLRKLILQLSRLTSSEPDNSLID